MKTLIVVDMQNDFIDGSLANHAAQAIVKPMAEYIKNFEGNVIFTRDTHFDDYIETQEGKNLPIPHCIHGTEGWEINDTLFEAVRDKENWQSVNKFAFGDIRRLVRETDIVNTDEIYLCGTCTDICVISIGLNLKARCPEVKMYCVADLCAGLTPEKHASALEVMKSCQIEVI
jgi:nicotinamidase-related amidase